jgi:hypothetical protein
MKQHAQTVDPIRLILEENIGPVTVDVAQRNGGYHGTLTLSGKIDAPAGAPAPADLAAVLSIEPTEVSQSFFAGVGLPFCFAQLKSNEAVDRAAVNRAAWTATLSRAWSPNLFFFAGDLRDGGNLYARMCAPALGVEEDPATGSACAALVGAMASKHDFGGTAYRLSIQQGVLCQRWWCHGLHRYRRNRGSAVRACVLDRRGCPHACKPAAMSDQTCGPGTSPAFASMIVNFTPVVHAASGRVAGIARYSRGRKNAADTIFGDDSGQRARRKCDGAGAG